MTYSSLHSNQYRCAICGSIQPGTPCMIVRQTPRSINGMHAASQNPTEVSFCSPFCAARYLNGICSQSYQNSRDIGNDPRAIAWGVDLHRSIEGILK